MSTGTPHVHPVTVVLPPVPGRLVGGKYELLRKLGEGSMGEVWVAVHRTLGEEVAIKLLTRHQELAQLEGAAKAAARFRFEAQVAARLSRASPHIVQVTNHGEEGPLAYLVMELLSGQSLETRLLRRGPVEPREVASYVRQVARALEVAHAEGVVHRDLKPANIFLARGVEGEVRVKLLDFGIARALGPDHASSPFATASHVVLGTPGYMSPEHVDGVEPLDHRCDLWALATVAYEALTGELPVPGVHGDELLANLRDRKIVPIHERDAALPAGLDAFFARAFAPNLGDRFASASELADALERAVAPLPASDAPTAFVRAPPQRLADATSTRRDRAPAAPTERPGPPRRRRPPRRLRGRLPRAARARDRAAGPGSPRRHDVGNRPAHAPGRRLPAGRQRAGERTPACHRLREPAHAARVGPARPRARRARRLQRALRVRRIGHQALEAQVPVVQSVGQDAPHARVRPSEQTVGVPAPQEVMSQSCVPATPGLGQRTTQLAPGGHTVWHGPLAHAKSQLLPAAHVQVPFAHVPAQDGLSPSQVTWQGGAPHENAQLAPSSQVHSPLAQTPVHDAASPHSTWQGGASHEKLQAA